MNWTPYILAGITIAVGLISWLFKQLIWQPQQDLKKAVGELKEEVVGGQKDVVRLQEAFKYYLSVQSKGAAMVLDSPNPTPDEVRQLLQKQVAGQSLTLEEREQLIGYLRRLRNDPVVPKSERSAAIQLLAAMETIMLMPSRDS